MGTNIRRRSSSTRRNASWPRASGFRRGSRNRKAGWYKVWKIMPENKGVSKSRPTRSRIGRSSSGKKCRAAVAPRRTTTAGRCSSIWRRRYGRQLAASSGVGGRLLGGRHLTTLAIKTSRSVFKPIDSKSSSRTFPARPTKACPRSSSVAPGASPTTRIRDAGLPRSTTIDRRPTQSAGQRAQAEAASRSRKSA